MKGSGIKSYIYRYFFEPPKEQDKAFLQELIETSARSEFRVRVRGMHPLADFRSAIQETIEQPQHGKHFFKMA